MSDMMSGIINSTDVLSAFLQKLDSISHEGMKNISTMLNEMYGAQNENFSNSLMQIQEHLKQFWDEQIEAVKESQNEFANRLESLAKETHELEKALGLSHNKSSSYCDSAPLVQLEKEQKALLVSYTNMKKERLAKYSLLVEKEFELCSILNEAPTLGNNDYSSTEVNLKSPRSLPQQPRIEQIPSEETILHAEQRIEALEDRKNQMESDFRDHKEELRILLDECEAAPFNLIERFAYSQNGETEFPCNKQNFDMLMSTTEKYTSIKVNAQNNADQMRQEISTLWKKMKKDEEELHEFLSKQHGYKKSTLTVLEDVLQRLRQERKDRMKELILQQRIVLDELWTKCCYTDQQRNRFHPYSSNHCTEDVLQMHEVEAENLQTFYETWKEVFELAGQHEELWQRLLHLENEAKMSDRLFHNRGGRLLKEEQERKLVQKKLPAIKKRIVSLLKQYETLSGEHFLYYGTPLLHTLEQQEKEREVVKEAEKQQRKVTNQENVKLESRLGTLPPNVVGNKRKLLTPQLNVREERAARRMNTPCPEGATLIFATPRTPVREIQNLPSPNGSPTYESFQEHIESVRVEDCLSSTRDHAQRILRSKNENESPRVTPYMTVKTIVKTPTKTPFKIATGLKIPSIVLPLSPRSATKRTPRNKLPIIF